MSFFAILWLLSGLVIAILAWYGIYYLRINFLNPTGKGADKKTTRTLSRFALVRRFRVLSDLHLQVDGKEYHIENMLIGYFGILLVHTLGARGEHYGTLEGGSWSRVLDGQKTTFDNPIKQQQQAIAALRTVFSRSNLYSIPIEHIVVMSSRAKKTALYVKHSGEILAPGQLSGHLGKTKFEKDLGFDVEKLAQAVLSACHNQ